MKVVQKKRQPWIPQDNLKRNLFRIGKFKVLKGIAIFLMAAEFLQIEKELIVTLI